MGPQSLKLVRQLKKLRQQRNNFRKTTEELENEAREVLEGHLRSILGSMTVEEITKTVINLAKVYKKLPVLT